MYNSEWENTSYEKVSLYSMATKMKLIIPPTFFFFLFTE